MKKTKILIIPILALFAFTLSGCGSKSDTASTAPAPIAVKGQTVEQSASVKQSLSYPGLVVADSEATIVAKASGNLTNANFKVGDKVSLGQELAKIDDVNSASFNAANFNTNQIKQAKISVASAEAAYNLAKSNYDSILISSVKDLRSAEIARDQAAKGKSNLDITTADSVKSAELAYETAKIASQQAASTLANREKLADQSAKDTKTNADLAASTVTSAAGAIITNINNIASFDANNSVTIGYRSNLGSLDSGTYDKAKQSYQAAKDAYVSYQGKKFASVDDEVEAAINVANKAKAMADDAKNLLDKTSTSSSLPQSAVNGPSLSAFQTAVAGYQSQINAAVNQINSAKQGLVNIDLNNSTLLDSLRQAAQIAQQQEASAKQSLANLKSGNTSQQNQAGFNYNLADNQFANAKVKIDAQVNAARTQAETAQLQYNNAVVALQNLFDAHSVIAPIDGTVTKVFIANGQAVSQGQSIATVSQVQNIKVQFYIEAGDLLDIKPGLPVKVVDNNNVTYSGAISAVSPQADPLTKRFLAEIKLEKADGLLLGTVVNVSLETVKTASGQGLIILPLSAVTVGQNGNYIFIADNNTAKKVNVEIKEVLGELAKIQVDLPTSTIIITDGNRLLQEGQAVSVSN